MQRPPTPSKATRHVRAPRPLHFPSEAKVPETKRHMELRTLLYAVLKHAFSAHAHVGSEQFVYFRASDPRRCVAPDAFLRRGGPDETFDTWKTWERGAPEICVEIASENEDRTWEEKLAAYHELGVLELVRFDADAEPGERLRVWDRVDGDLVERVVEGERASCAVVGGVWIVCPAEGYAAALRLEDDSASSASSAITRASAASRARASASAGVGISSPRRRER